MGKLTLDNSSLKEIKSEGKSLAAFQNSRIVGCYFCESRLPIEFLNEDVNVIDAKFGYVITCPACGIDSLLPGSTVKITPRLLETLRNRYFNY